MFFFCHFSQNRFSLCKKGKGTTRVSFFEDNFHFILLITNFEKAKKYQLPADGKMIDVTEEQYREFYRYKRREKYLKESDQEHKLYHYSDLDTDELLGEEMFSYPNEESVEDRVVDHILRETVRRYVEELPEEERVLVFALYYQKKTERDCAEELGVCQKTINNQRKQILAKLKKMMNIL